MNIERPELGVEKNIADKDPRFIGIYGYVYCTPGVEKNDLSLTDKYGIRCLDGISDAIENEHGKLIETAIKYTEEYNHILQKKFKSKEGT